MSSKTYMTCVASKRLNIPMKLSDLEKKPNYMTRFKNIAKCLLNHEKLIFKSSLLTQLLTIMIENHAENNL